MISVQKQVNYLFQASSGPQNDVLEKSRENDLNVIYTPDIWCVNTA